MTFKSLRLLVATAFPQPAMLLFLLLLLLRVKKPRRRMRWLVKASVSFFDPGAGAGLESRAATQGVCVGVRKKRKGRVKSRQPAAWTTPKRRGQPKMRRSGRRLRADLTVPCKKACVASDWSSPLKSETKQLCKRGGASTPAMGTKLFFFFASDRSSALCGSAAGPSAKRKKEARGATQAWGAIQAEGGSGGSGRREAEIPHHRSCLLFVARKEGTFRIKTHEGESWFRPHWLVIRENSH